MGPNALGFQVLQDVSDGSHRVVVSMTLGEMFAVFLAITLLQCIAQKFFHKTEVTSYRFIVKYQQKNGNLC